MNPTINIEVKSSRQNRLMREAMKRLAQKRDEDTGGIMMPSQKAHKSRVAYSRRDFRRGDWE